MKKEFVIIVLAIAAMLIIAYYQEIREAVIFFVYTTVGILLLFLIGITCLGIWYVVERVRSVRARRIEAEKQAQVLTLTVGNQVFVRDTNPRATWRLMHLEARTYITNTHREPSEREVRQWQLFNAPKPATNQPVALLPPQGAVDVMVVLDTAQCGLIVGQRDSGKTTLLQHVISRRLGRSHVLVLDPHSHPSRWPGGSQVVGTERDFVKIEAALRGLLALMNKRYRDIGKGLVVEGEHEPVTVIIDEWRAIVLELGKPAADIIKTLLAESRKTNIDVLVGSHSERVKALGIEGEGDLKEGFVIVRLTINKLTGERKATIDYGDGEVPAVLPGPYRSASHPQIGERHSIISVEPKPSEQEQAILDLFDQQAEQGEVNKAKISVEVFGSKGGNQYKKIDEILEKFGRV